MKSAPFFGLVAGATMSVLTLVLLTSCPNPFEEASLPRRSPTARAPVTITSPEPESYFSAYDYGERHDPRPGCRGQRN